MKKVAYLIYLVAALGGCLFLFISMFFDNNAMDNEKEVQAPAIVQNGKLNQNISQDTENYLANHLGNRQLLLDAYSNFLSNGFRTSSVGNVIIGKEGYLYFGETVNDYHGNVTLSDRGLYNTQRMLELLQEAVEDKGGQFLFLVAPNKNSVYDYMPDRYLKTSVNNNWRLLNQQLTKVNSIDVFPIFQDSKDELYYKTDTHWNNEGARRVYDQVLDTIGKDHDDFLSYEKDTSQTMTGDLYKMLYASEENNESVIEYGKEQAYTYLTRTRSTEQAYIESSNEHASGSLLMFRDSFANNLIPFFSDAYGKAIYDKSSPYDLRKMNTYGADTVILEIAERNLPLLQKTVPIIFAPTRQQITGDNVTDLIAVIDYNTEKEISSITGKLNAKYCGKDSNIYAQIGDKCYELTPQSFEDSEYGFCGYFDHIPKDMGITIHVTNGQQCYSQKVSPK